MQKVLTKWCQYFLIFNAEICGAQISAWYGHLTCPLQRLQTSKGWNSNSFFYRFFAFPAQKYLFLVYLFYRPIGIVH